MAADTLLDVRGVSKKFGGVQAVRDVGFTLNQGQVMGVIGPNGAGKTTLVNLVTGFVKPDGGRILYKGKNIAGMAPNKIANLGIARTFQVMRPYHSLPTYKNLIVPLNSPRVRKATAGKLGDLDSVAIDILEEIGFERDARVPYKIAGSLPLGYQKRLELARCIALRPEIILCDEVFSGLSMSEISSMIPLLEKFVIEGMTLIMVEHRLRELFRVADKVLVMNFGEKIAEGPPQEVMKQDNVKAAYIGGDRSK
ncbi:MAG: ABC transporter ATP-binding protein [Desulfomonile sp.]|jgi:ABC-type branched-subunit amino acid transport system ATPase component|nr:ABC transporter ATP-binding protein [Deltaproteobacteria bacterium]